LAGALVCALIGASGALAGEGTAPIPAPPDIVQQANAPISSILQVRLQDSYAPRFTDMPGQGNAFAIALTMPLPAYRLLRFPQLSLLTIPAAITVPGDGTGFGDVRLVDIAIFNAGDKAIWGVGPTFVFPTASQNTTGQGKWQAGPAAAIAFPHERWLAGVLAQNPISFAGDRMRADVNALFLQPFLTYKLDRGWFVRSQPQMIFNWKTHKQLLPLDLGVGRVFKIGRQDVSCFVEGFWNISHDRLGPSYGFTVGVSLLYPHFWEHRSRNPGDAALRLRQN
jgi:hypothetical protein